MNRPGGHYRGRFAPTPSGPLHVGSLVTALASWLDARAHAGKWLLRIDDIDPPRQQAGAAELICRQLERCALHWDAAVIYQSQRSAAYQAALSALLASDAAFYCRLSRSALKACGQRHPGRAAAATDNPRDAAIRLDVEAAPLCFEDRFQGRQCIALQHDGPFVIGRRDGLFAYQLACAVDDAEYHITDVVRGIDLLDSSARQIAVLRALGHSPPRYAHLPVVRDAAGIKLSKSAGSAALELTDPARALDQAMQWLGLTVDRDTPERMLQQAVACWPARLAKGW